MGRSARLFEDAFRADWPQTEEEVLSANRYIEVNRELLAGAKCILLEATGFADWAATRVLIDKGDRILWAVSFWTAREGKLVEATEYFPTPKEPKMRNPLIAPKSTKTTALDIISVIA